MQASNQTREPIWPVVARLFRTAGLLRFWFFVALVIDLVQAAFVVLNNDLIRRVFDSVSAANLQAFWLFVSLSLGLGILSFPLTYTKSHFCVGADLITSNLRPGWVLPGSRGLPDFAYGFMAPESPWTDLLCERITEFLTMYPSEFLLFDWFVYGSLRPDFAVQPAWFVKQPFEEIIGREMPATAAEITPAESLAYKRAVLARQFRRIQAAVRSASPQTKIGFNVPFWGAAEPLWVDNPMLNESDFLVAESTRPEIIDWLADVRKPGQHIMTTLIGRTEEGETDPRRWQKLVEKGCDYFFGYGWGTPPDFHPHAHYGEDLELVRQAFRDMG